MAEPKGEELDRIARTFIGAYNKRYGTGYDRWSEGQKEPTDLLFHGTDSAAALAVQLARAVYDGKSEFQHPAEVQRCIALPLRQRIRALRPCGLMVSLQVDRLPASRKDKRKLLDDLTACVVAAIGRSATSTTSLLSIDRDAAARYAPLAEYVSHLEVLATGPDHPSALLWGDHDGAFACIVGLQAWTELLRKTDHYQQAARDHVLAIQCETMPHDERDVAELQERIRGADEVPPFRSVWLVSTWSGSRADQVWPE